MTTYSKCRECGHVEDGVCGLFFGHRCDQCGAVDAAVIKRRRPRERERCPAGICRRPAGHAGPHSDLPREGER